MNIFVSLNVNRLLHLSALADTTFHMPMHSVLHKPMECECVKVRKCECVRVWV